MSDKHLDEDLLLRPEEITRETLRSLIEAAEAGSARLNNWLIFGRPVIDGVVAEVSVPAPEAAAFVERVLSVPNFRPCLRGCVYGIIKLDGVNFKITAGRAN
jgi:hypothetical protein